MPRGISLTREGEAKVFIPNRGDAWRIRIVASDAESMPNEVFGHKLRLVNPHTGLQGHEFCFVTSPEDLVVYPIGIPNVTQTPPYYRLSVIDVIVASRHIADLLWNAVDARVCALVVTLNKKDRLKVEETKRCGDPITIPETSVSVSESLSLSQSVSVSP